MSTDVSQIGAAVSNIQISGPEDGGAGGASAQVGETPNSSTPASALFDATPYIEGMSADEIRIVFTGGVAYDVDSPQGQELFNRLSLGQEVELRVSAVVATKAGRYKRTKDDVETITGVVGLKVDTFYLPAAEELE